MKKHFRLILLWSKECMTTILLWLSLLVGEIHTFWEKPSKTVMENGYQVLYVKENGKWVRVNTENWIIDLYVPMPVQQNVKMVTDEAWPIIIFAIMFLVLTGDQNNRINRATVLAFLLFMVIDAIMYFYNYKTANYSISYFLLFVSWVIFYRYGRRNTTKDRPRVAY